MRFIFAFYLFFLTDHNLFAVNASVNHPKFGYHCVHKNSESEVPRKELRKACDRIRTAGDLEVDEYNIGRLTCKRVNYGVPGPCGENKVFIERYHEKNNPCGLCVCNDNGPRKLLYHPPTNKCFYIYDQGFCPVGSLIAVNKKTKKLGCTRNPCHSAKTYQVLFKGKCVELYTKAEECKAGEFLGFELNDPEPKCTKPYPNKYEDGNFDESEEDILSGGLPPKGDGIFHFNQDPYECPSGQQLSISGKCAGSWEW